MTTSNIETSMHVITGSIGYRERIALLPGSLATVSLIDHSLADAPAPVLSEATIELGDRQVPVPFSLSVPSSRFDGRHRYAVRAVIRSSAGQLLWTTDTVHAVDVAAPSQDLGLLTLIRVRQTPPPAAPGNSLHPGKEWVVEDVNRGGVIDNSRITITFTEDGFIRGSKGCNSYTGKYRSDRSTIGLDGPMAVTRKMCPPALMDQEAKFLSILGGNLTHSVATDGSLILTSATGQTLLAR